MEYIEKKRLWNIKKLSWHTQEAILEHHSLWKPKKLEGFVEYQEDFMQYQEAYMECKEGP